MIWRPLDPARSGRSALALALVLAGAGAMSVGPAALPSAAQEDEGLSTMVSSFGRCAQADSSADVVLLLDRSLSLLDSDPDEVRRTASRSLVRDLADFAEASQVDLRLQVSGFTGKYLTQPRSWLVLPEFLDGALAQVDDVGGSQDLGSATDYWMALEGARKELARAESPCQMIVWFTDGMYDLAEDDRYGAELPYAPGTPVSTENKSVIIKKGLSSLCSPNSEHSKPVGPVNGLRSSGVYVATVGLKPTNPKEAAAAATTLERITTGSSDCGRPPAAGTSAMLPAAHASDLGRMLAGLSGGVPSSSPYKGRQATEPFGLDDSVNSVTVLADADSTGIQSTIDIGLQGPDDTEPVWFGQAEFAAGSGTKKVSGGNVTVGFEKVTARALRFTMDRSDKGWAGVWNVVFRAHERMPADALAHTVLKVYGDLEAVWTEPAIQGLAGATVPVTVAVQHIDGEPLTTSVPGARVSIDFEDRTGALTPLAAEPLTIEDLDQSIQVTLPDSPGPGRLLLTLAVTIPPDTALVPNVTSHEMEVLPPGGYPTIAETEVKFPEAKGLEPAVADVTAAGPGCVWLDTSRLAEELESVPEEFQAVTIESDHSDEQSCLLLAEGETRQLPMTMTPDTTDDRGGNGSISGTLHVITKAATGSAAPIDLPIAFAAERTKLPDVVGGGLTLVLGLILGLGLPAGLLMAVRARAAKIPISSLDFGDLAYVFKRFRVTDGRVLDTQTNSPIAIVQGDPLVASMSAAPSVSSLAVEGVDITGRAFGNPFALPDARVARQDGPVVTDLSFSVSKSGDATLPLGVQGHWVAWHDGGDEFAVLMFVPLMQTGDAHLAEMSRRAEETLTDSAALLSELAARSDSVVAMAGAPSVDVHDGASGAFDVQATTFGGMGGPFDESANSFGGADTTFDQPTTSFDPPGPDSTGTPDQPSPAAPAAPAPERDDDSEWGPAW